MRLDDSPPECFGILREGPDRNEKREDSFGSSERFGFVRSTKCRGKPLFRASNLRLGNIAHQRFQLAPKMSDPLLALQQAIKHQTQIKYSSQIQIGEKTFPKSTPTRYRKAGGRADFYSLEALYLAWHLKDATGAGYMKQTREYGLTAGFVSVTERKHVVDWLEGRTGVDLDRVAPLEGECAA